jgi:hypothetical protein
MKKVAKKKSKRKVLKRKNPDNFEALENEFVEKTKQALNDLKKNPEAADKYSIDVLKNLYTIFKDKDIPIWSKYRIVQELHLLCDQLTDSWLYGEMN